MTKRTQPVLNSGEKEGIVYAIRFSTTGEEKVARQIARLDQTLNLLRGGRSAKGVFYNSSVFGNTLREKLFGKGSRSFRKQIRQLLLDTAIDICVGLIARTHGTTGNTAFSWHVSIVKGEDSFNHGKYYHNPEGYLQRLAKDAESSSEYHTAQAGATARENALRSRSDLQPLSKNGYTIYISNYAFVAPYGYQVKNFVFRGYYARFMLDNGYGRYKTGRNMSSEGMDEYVQNTFRKLFNEGLRKIK